MNDPHMNPLHKIWLKLRSLGQRREVKQEIDEELRFHLEQRTAENIAAGMTPEDAAREARKRFGNWQSVREECREVRGASFGEATWMDLKFACRQLRKNPGFTAIAVLTLALGIGANTAIFSVINGVLLKPLSYPEPDRLVTLWERSPVRGIEQERVSGPNYLDWRQQNTVFEELAVSPGWDGAEEFNLVLTDTTAKVRASYTSASLFTTLRTRPLLGRTLLPEEDVKEGPRAAVLSYGLWQRHFNVDSNVLGRALTVDIYGRRDYTIVGVMPPSFGLPSRCELWLPLGWMGVTLDERRSAHWHNVIARLKPRITIAQARTELSAIQARLKQAYPGMSIGSEVVVTPLVEQALGRNLHLGLLILWGVIAGVLLIACANLANLLLARAVSRHREIAVRLALGASRWRVLRQLLVESLLLAGLGGVVGVLWGWWGLKLFVAASPANIPRLADVSLDGTALGFTLLVSVFTGLLFGIVPAWQGSRADLGGRLEGFRPRRFRGNVHQPDAQPAGHRRGRAVARVARGRGADAAKLRADAAVGAGLRAGASGDRRVGFFRVELHGMDATHRHSPAGGLAPVDGTPARVAGCAGGGRGQPAAPAREPTAA